MGQVEITQKEQSWVQKISIDWLIALGCSILLGLISQVSIPLPFTPVPQTLQTFGVFMIGGLFGVRRAFLSILFYLLQGTVGFPVFAGGISNPLWILDCKAGYLISFLPAALSISLGMKSRLRNNYFFVVSIICIAQLIIFVIGAYWLSFTIGVKKAVVYGIVPFLTGAILKILCASSCVVFLKKRSVCQK